MVFKTGALIANDECEVLSKNASLLLQFTEEDKG